MILNSDLCLSPLESIYDKSIIKYKAGAYLHWYKDVSADDFKQAFLTVKDTIDAYQNVN